MKQNRIESIQAPDGGHFDGHVSVPAAGHGPGVLLIQEVFGVNDYVKEVADRLADLGYVVLAPDVFWRQQPDLALDSSDQSNIEPAIEIAGQWDPDVGLADLGAALEHLTGLSEVTGPIGVIGFCFGGTQAFRLAQHLEPACAVSYYGSGVADLLDDLHTITCPTLLHFGDADPFIPNESVAAIKTAAATNHHVVVKVHENAGHAFDNHLAPHFSQPDAAKNAWIETALFLYTHLGPAHAGA